MTACGGGSDEEMGSPSGSDCSGEPAGRRCIIIQMYVHKAEFKDCECDIYSGWACVNGLGRACSSLLFIFTYLPHHIYYPTGLYVVVDGGVLLKHMYRIA